MYVAGLACALDEQLGQTVESIDGKGAGVRVFGPFPAPEGRVAIAAAEDAARAFERHGHRDARRR